MSALPRGTRTRLKHSVGASPSIKVQGTLSLSPSFESVRPTSPTAVNTLNQQTRQSSVPMQMHLSNGPLMLETTPASGFPGSSDRDVPAEASFASSPIIQTTAFSDNESSILSELEDGPDDNDDIASGGTESESSSDSDSEAETERLEISPRKHRRLPSGAERVDGADSRNTDLATGVEMSGLTTEPIDQLAEQEEATMDVEELAIDDQPLTERLLEDIDIRSLSGLAGRKRKRTNSLSGDARELSSDSGHRSRRSTSIRREKRLLQPHKISIFNNESAIADDEASEPLSDVSSVDDEPPTTLLFEQLVAEKDVLDPSSDEEGDASEGESGKVTEEPGSGIATIIPESGMEKGEVVGLEAEGEEADTAVKSEDELAKKKTAMDALVPIENLFAIFRDRLFGERLAQLDAELDVLHDPNTKHPDFLAMQQCLNVRRDEKIQLEERTLYYKNKCSETITLATRAQLHSQYYQSVRVIRERHTDALNKTFSAIQRERRQLQSREPEFGYKFNAKRSTQIANQAAYNKEVSLLSGIARHVGFPAAPELPGARASEIDDDFRAMQIKPVTSKPKPFVARLATSRADEAAAEEQFLERNPWANPNHPSHQHAHLLERPISTSQLLRHPLAGATPVAQRWLPDVHQQPGVTPSTSNTAAPAASEPQAAMASGAPYRISNGGSSPFEQHPTRPRDRDLSHSTAAPSRFERPYKPKNMPPSTLSATSSQGEAIPLSISPAARHQQPLLTQPLSSLAHAMPELQHVGGVADGARVRDGTSRYSSPASGLTREARFMAVI